MSTPQNPGDPWATHGPPNPSGGYPQAGQPGTGPGATPTGYPTGGYQAGGYQQPGGYPTGDYPQPGGYPATGYPAQPGYPAQQGYPQQGYPQQGYPQQGYPQSGYPQAGYPQPGMPGYGVPVYPGGVPAYGAAALGPAPARPMTVTIAFWLWILTVIAGVVSIVVIFTSNVFAAALTAAGVSELDTAYRTAINTVRIAAVIGAAIFAGLYLLFAFKMLVGRNWARIVLTVVAALGIVNSFAAVGARTTVDGVVINVRPTIVIAVGWVQAVIGILAIVLMYAGGANQYFAAMRARRMYR
jgi:hypothetical protein